jgi:integrase
MAVVVPLRKANAPKPHKPRKLTRTRIDELHPRAEQYVEWCVDPPGFGVRVSPAGTVAYILKFRLKSGRVRWATLGRLEDLSLEQARDKAREYRGIAATGKDPLQQIDTSRTAPTVATVAERFLKEHVARKKPGTVRMYEGAIRKCIIPTLGAIPIAELGTDDAMRLHHRLRKTPYAANRALACLSKLLAWSMRAKLRPAGPNPCLGIEKYREEKRRRYLAPAELARVGAALRVAERREAISPSSLAILRLLMLTGARVSEITTLQWPHVDLTRGVLNLPESKTGQKVILLPAAAVDLLREWPRFAGTDYLFPGEGRKAKGAHRDTPKDAWAWVRTRAKIPDVRLHDLRHSYASVAVSAGHSLPMIGALLGHSQPATTARYSHLHADPLRAASEQTGGAIAAALARRVRP